MQNTDFYASILQFGPDWKITRVDVDHARREVEVYVEYTQQVGASPETGEPCPIYDHREERRWRHLDTMQYKTFIHARVPRVTLPTGKVVTMRVPWADESSRQTWHFEAWAIELLSATKNQRATGRLLDISFDQLHRIMERAVERGLAAREAEFAAEQQSDHYATTAVSIDEKCYRREREFVTIVSDPVHGRVLEVADGRTAEAAQSALESALPPRQLRKIEAVSLDLAPAYSQAAARVLSQARIVYDKFHLIKNLTDAIDETRRREVKTQPVLKRTRHLWLKPAARHSLMDQKKFAQISEINLRTSAAWRIRENFRALYTTCRNWREALHYFLLWKHHTMNSMIKPMERVAKTFERHVAGILSYFDFPITSAKAEQLNASIQQLIVVAKGYRSVANIRIAILFFYGKLKLLPQLSQ